MVKSGLKVKYHRAATSVWLQKSSIDQDQARRAEIR